MQIRLKELADTSAELAAEAAAEAMQLNQQLALAHAVGTNQDKQMQVRATSCSCIDHMA